MLKIPSDFRDTLHIPDQTKKKNAWMVGLFAFILSIIAVMDTIMVFQMTSRLTRDSGSYQIKNVSSKLENTISAARNRTMGLALKAQYLVKDRQKLRDFIYSTKRGLAQETGGECFNIYVAGKGWDIIPDFDKPKDYVVTERSWYVGALRNSGAAYVTAPYYDAWTGNICYSVSVVMEDGETVLAVDYTMRNITKYINEICDNWASNAVIVTEDGTIAGARDGSLVTKKLAEVLPTYLGIYNASKDKYQVINGQDGTGFFADNLYASHCTSGWYLIVSENDWLLYKDAYIQLVLTILLNIGLFVVIIKLYLSSRRAQEKAEEALSAKENFLRNISGSLMEPLQFIMQRTGKEAISDKSKHYDNLRSIRDAGERLQGMIDKLLSYSTLVKMEEDSQLAETVNSEISHSNKRFRMGIVFLLVIMMGINLYSSITTTYNLGRLGMEREAQTYRDHTAEWFTGQKGQLDMFCSIISNHPEMLDDYQGTVAYLNGITKQYPEISVTYMTCPNRKHTVYMNNGWQPPANWKVEERQWYKDTLASPNGWSVSEPYYDQQTGYYCVTVSKCVYENKTGEFLGIFGIDFYMDKLVDILGSSYSNDGYAFLVDKSGEIVNHPYGLFHMNVNGITNISDSPYKDAVADGKTISFFTDYDGEKKLLIATEDPTSGFVVFVVTSIWKIFGSAVIYALFSMLVFVGCIVAVFRMITHFMQLQEAANRKLRDAAESAIATGNAKSQFLAHMSHEIRTPINAVLGMNEMIMRESQDQDIREYAQNISSAGRTLLSLINSILDFSKLEDGKMEIVPGTYELGSLISGLINSVSERARKKGLELVVHVDERLPRGLYGDDVRLTQIIANLLTNSVKYTEQGNVELNLKEMGRQTGEITIRVEVKDTGIGIKPEDMENLFSPFQRLEESRNRNVEGTGLGMSIVSKLLNMMGSKLEVESVYGKGSTFGFVIRQGVVDQEPIGDYTKHIHKATQATEEGRFLYAPEAKLLIVDDNDMNLKVAVGLLKRNGIIPDTATSGREALEKLRHNSYHVIMLDHMMPEMDGIETLQAIREQQLAPESTAIIALTANAIKGAREQYIEAGFNDYLSKPLEVDTLEKKLAACLPWDLVGYKQVIPAQPEQTGQTGQTAQAEKTVQPEKEEANTDSYSLEELKSWAEQVPEVNVLAGMKYCMDSRMFYEAITAQFLEGDKRPELQKCLETEDFENYRIQIHALKGNALNIGADVLSNQAKALEMALKMDNDTSYVKAHHDEVMKDYGNLLEKLKAKLGK